MKNLSQSYQKTADVLRQAASEKLGPRDPAHTLLTLAANQLETAADTAMLLEQATQIIEELSGNADMIETKPKNTGQWEGDRAAEIRAAWCKGFACGSVLIAFIAAVLIAGVLA